MTDEVLFQEGAVTVTNALLKIDATMYPVRNITSVQSATIPPVTSGYIGSVCLGVVLGLACLANGLTTELLCSLWLPVVFIVVGVVGVKRARNTFVLRISTSGGQVDALKSFDETTIHRVAQAVTEAIAKLR